MDIIAFLVDFGKGICYNSVVFLQLQRLENTSMKKLISLLLVLTMLMSFTACTQQLPQSDETFRETTVAAVPSTEETEPETTVAISHYPVTVIDQAGREVVIEEEPQRLISAYYITTSLLMALDLEDRMVGIENTPEKRAVYGLSAPNLLTLPTVGTAKELDLETVASLEPDLLVLPVKLKNTVEALETLGFDVLLVDPEDQDRLEGMIELIALATNKEKKARQLLAFIHEQQSFLTDVLEGVEMPRVYLAGNSSMLKTAGNAMYQANMIHLAGGVNVANEIGDTYWAEIDYEQLLTWNPDYIILAAEATYTVDDVLADPNLADCAAVKNSNVYLLPNNAEAWDSPVPGSILGSLWLANILHKDKVSDAECAARTDAYYEMFYSFTYSKN